MLAGLLKGPSQPLSAYVFTKKVAGTLSFFSTSSKGVRLAAWGPSSKVSARTCGRSRNGAGLQSEHLLWPQVYDSMLQLLLGVLVMERCCCWGLPAAESSSLAST